MKTGIVPDEYDISSSGSLNHSLYNSMIRSGGKRIRKSYTKDKLLISESWIKGLKYYSEIYRCY
jgi:hypothetical protein